ncbi:MAG: nitroreductase family protein [Kiritimatiellae bacterium]|nr:nitroreductase family protein [Kiritimatiellia bacterium]
MNTMDALVTRRTIRAYQPDRVPPELVDRWLRSAMRAPSSADARPWQFVVVSDRATLQRLDAAMPKCDMLKTAPMAILVVADPSREKIPGFLPQDCACVTEYLLLAIHDSGYGACWIGVHPVPDRERVCREILGIPETIIPFALLTLGRPAETPAPDDRYDPSIVHAERW